MGYHYCELCHHPMDRHKYGPSMDPDCIGDCEICNVQSSYYQFCQKAFPYVLIAFALCIIHLALTG